MILKALNVSHQYVVQQHQIVLLCKPYETEYFRYARLLDTPEYTDGTTAAELNVFLMLTGLLWIVPVPETTL